jgi:hypothetical protein
MLRPILINLIIGLLSAIIGGYSGWFGKRWRGPYYGGGIGFVAIVLLIVLLT